MDIDDFGAALIGVFVVVSLIVYLIRLLIKVAIGVAIAAIVAAFIFGAGLITSLILWDFVNLFDWRRVHEEWIWSAIVSLVFLPLTILPFWLHMTYASLGVIAFVIYAVWLAGYVWGWANRQSLGCGGMADAVLTSTLIATQTKFLMAWEYIVIRIRIAFLGV